MSDKYAALKQAAEKAQLESKDEWGYDTDAFHDEASPATILELLAERDADRAQLAELAAQYPVAWGNIEYLMRHGYCSICENKDDVIGEPSTPLFTRAAPAASLTVKLPQGYTVRAGHPINEGERGVMIPNDGGDWLNRFDVERELRAAGIKLQIEGE